MRRQEFLVLLRGLRHADELLLHSLCHLLKCVRTRLNALQAGLVDHRRPRDGLLRLEALELGSVLLPDLLLLLSLHRHLRDVVFLLSLALEFRRFLLRLMQNEGYHLTDLLLTVDLHGCGPTPCE